MESVCRGDCSFDSHLLTAATSSALSSVLLVFSQVPVCICVCFSDAITVAVLQGSTLSGHVVTCKLTRLYTVSCMSNLFSMLHTLAYTRTQHNTHTHTHMCVRTHTHVHTHAHACTHTYIHARTRTHIHTHAHTRTHTRAHTCKRTHTHAHTHTLTNRSNYTLPVSTLDQLACSFKVLLRRLEKHTAHLLHCIHHSLS